VVAIIVIQKCQPNPSFRCKTKTPFLASNNQNIVKKHQLEINQNCQWVSNITSVSTFKSALYWTASCNKSVHISTISIIYSQYFYINAKELKSNSRHLWQNARICGAGSNSWILQIPRWPLKIYRATDSYSKVTITFKSLNG